MIQEITSREQLTEDERKLLAAAMIGHGNRKAVMSATGLSAGVLYDARDANRNISLNSLMPIRQYLQSIYNPQKVA